MNPVKMFWVLLLVLLTTGGLHSSAYAQAQLVASNGGTRVCMDVPLRMMGTQLTSHACHDGDNQQFTFEQHTDINAIFIKVFNEGTCVAANDGKVILKTCDRADVSQRWWHHSKGSLQNHGDRRCIDVPGGNTTNGVRLILWDCHGGWNQAWQREAVVPATVAFDVWVAQRFRQGGFRASYEVGQVVGQIIGHDSGSIIAPGGGNIISTGGGNLTPDRIAGIIATGGGNIIATGGLNLKEYTAGIIAAGGGNVIAPGGGNFADAVMVDLVGRIARLLNNDPEVLGRIIATGGGNLIEAVSIPRLQQAATGAIISTGGGNVIAPHYMAGLRASIIATGGGNVIAPGGGNLADLVVNDIAAIIATGGGNIIAPGGGNLTLGDRGAFLSRTFDLTGMKDDFLAKTVAGLSRGSGYGTLASGGSLNAEALRNNGFSSSYVDALVSRGYATAPPPAPVARAYQGQPASPTPPPSQPASTAWSPPSSSTGNWGASTTPMTRGQGYPTRTWGAPTAPWSPKPAPPQEAQQEGDEADGSEGERKTLPQMDASELRAEIARIDGRIDRLNRRIEAATTVEQEAKLKKNLENQRARRDRAERLLTAKGG